MAGAQQSCVQVISLTPHLLFHQWGAEGRDSLNRGFCLAVKTVMNQRPTIWKRKAHTNVIINAAVIEVF